jgi:hypothetical protein
MSNPVIDIQPSSSGTRGLVLRLRFRDPSDVGVDVPLVGWIAIGKVGDQGNGCQIKSSTFVRMSEWKYGDVPDGFAKLGDCPPLGPGEYEVHVTGVGGRGTGRMKIAANGAVTRLPWDGLDKSVEDQR